MFLYNNCENNDSDISYLLRSITCMVDLLYSILFFRSRMIMRIIATTIRIESRPIGTMTIMGI